MVQGCTFNNFGTVKVSRCFFREEKILLTLRQRENLRKIQDSHEEENHRENDCEKSDSELFKDTSPQTNGDSEEGQKKNRNNEKTIANNDFEILNKVKKLEILLIFCNLPENISTL